MIHGMYEHATLAGMECNLLGLAVIWEGMQVIFITESIFYNVYKYGPT
jgi:hypothetical protein